MPCPPPVARRTGESVPASRPTPAAAPNVDTAELEQFLINFVVEQTGYPPEVVELDADLEADLGIDSIKKAQMFGELREYFDVTPTDNLTLDDFPTLRHIVNFLAAAPQKSAPQKGWHAGAVACGKEGFSDGNCCAIRGSPRRSGEQHRGCRRGYRAQRPHKRRRAVPARIFL